MKALEVTKDVSAAEDENTAVREYDYRVHCQPVLGRALSMLAMLAMERGEAVTSEGLLRTSIDLLGAPYCRSDTRHQYHHALAVYKYGYLQTRWEKREAAGEAVRCATTWLFVYC